MYKRIELQLSDGEWEKLFEAAREVAPDGKAGSGYWVAIGQPSLARRVMVVGVASGPDIYERTNPIVKRLVSEMKGKG